MWNHSTKIQRWQLCMLINWLYKFGNRTIKWLSAKFDSFRISGFLRLHFQMNFDQNKLNLHIYLTMGYITYFTKEPGIYIFNNSSTVLKFSQFQLEAHLSLYCSLGYACTFCVQLSLVFEKHYFIYFYFYIYIVLLYFIH